MKLKLVKVSDNQINYKSCKIKREEDNASDTKASDTKAMTLYNL